MRALLCLCVLALSFSRVSTARAESAPIRPIECEYRRTPHTSPPAGDIPANWPRILIHLVGFSADTSGVRLEAESTGIEVPVTVERLADGFEVVPSEVLVVGETYRLFHPWCPAESPETTLFTAIDPLPEPTSLGTLAVSPLHASFDARGRENLRYFVRVTLTLDPAMIPWSEVYRWALVVNGTLSADRELGIVEVDVPVGCNPSFPGEPEGLLSIGASASLSAIDRVVTAETVESTIECDDATIVHIGNLEPLTPDEIAFYEMPGPLPDMDAWVADPDGGVDGGRMGMHTEPDTHSTCTCSAAGARRSSSGAWPLALVLGLAIVRRKRSR